MIKRLAAFGMIMSLTSALWATGDPEQTNDPAEIRYITTSFEYDLIYQQWLRSLPAWQNFKSQFGIWNVHFNEFNAKPHRAYGSPIAVPGANAEQKALYFIQNNLTGFSIPVDELTEGVTTQPGKYEWVNFGQKYNGLEVLDSRLTVKLYNGQVVLFGADVFSDIAIGTTPDIDLSQATQFASAGIDQTILDVQYQGLKILPVPAYHNYEYHLVYDLMVHTKNDAGVPSNYVTYVDATNGTVLSRRNTVMHLGDELPGAPAKPSAAELLTVQAHITGDTYPLSPYDDIVTTDLPNLRVTINGNNYYTDENGLMTAPVNGPIQGAVRLQGLWSIVYTDNVTPSFSAPLQEGSNNVFFADQYSNIKERTAYVHVNAIHDHMKYWMPSFTGMDVALPTNVDVAGECNAFYDGASINFYDIGGGCNASSLIGDVVYHEYGHGINDLFYQSQGGTFINGAMGEGYADYWAISLSNNPILGSGFYTDSQDGIRRYDIDPKVYPDDLIGEVHSDGEIICGAWYDTHLLLGGDWNTTMPIFLEAYAGLQAEQPDGNEGVAYTDVLLDALFADDDDGDISNGTPNWEAIIDGFDMHGITLLSSAELDHNDLEFADAELPITIHADLTITFPFDQFLSGVNCFYKINNGVWNEISMLDDGNGNYSADIPAQPKGTVIAYYLGTEDQQGNLSNVLPIGAALNPYPNLPYFILVGVDEVGRHDCDDNEDWGAWTTGINGDNATTGEWTLDIPTGSFSTPGDFSTVVQTYFQHTPGGEYCFVTGNAANEQSALGENDVDDGKTTLRTSLIDLSEYTSPVIAYWRWYTNNPPSGANPGADWWQVRISDDGGNTWSYVENTLTSEIGWRRNAFRVSDYVDPNDQIRLQFIASDSTHIGEYLDGGSLIEAAVDDFVVYDEEAGIGVSEDELQTGFDLFPNPATAMVQIGLVLPAPAHAVLRLFNALGELVYVEDLGELGSGSHQHALSVDKLAAGVYSLRLESGEAVLTRELIVRH